MRRHVAIVAGVTLAACTSAPAAATASQWEQTRYVARATAWTESGISLAGELDAGAVEAIADAVDVCLGAVDAARVLPAAQCWPSSAWALERRALTVLAVPGAPSCTVPGLWLLPDSAGSGCDTWGKPTRAPDGSDCSAAPCRWAVATQDRGRTVVVPAETPYARLGEGLARVGSSCLYPWADAQVAVCSAITLAP